MPDANNDLNGEERRALVAELKRSSAYTIAFYDEDFIKSDMMRPVRLELELVKPELILRRNKIRTSIVVFGSARTLPPDVAEPRFEHLVKQRESRPNDDALEREIKLAEKRVEQSRYYDEARRFSQIVSKSFKDEDRYDFVVFTGGGPGIMEAANRGAYDEKAMSAGLNITIPTEQEPNPYISPELCFQFHYFALRKMHFLLRAKALVAFPGGFGTFDELFEALTLIQTMKIRPMPVVLVGTNFWNQAVNFDFLVDEGVISPEDKSLFKMVETAQEAVDVIYDFYGGGVPE